MVRRSGKSQLRSPLINNIIFRASHWLRDASSGDFQETILPLQINKRRKLVK